MDLPLISIIIGTRPEAIKLAPLVLAFRKEKLINTRLILTGQHSEMVKNVIDIFGLRADLDLGIMKTKQSLTYITSKTLEGLKIEFQENRPNLVIVQGDTTTAFSAALAAFYEKIPVGHVEAGLRTENLMDPYPEELNRRLISQIASLHFAPTDLCRDNLLSSGVKNNIEVTGNTVIDSLITISRRAEPPILEKIDWKSKKVILSTIHRRENWGSKLIEISKGLRKVLDNNEDAFLLLPLHPNEIVRAPIRKVLANHSRTLLTEPLGYESLIGAIKGCYFIMTDSGGLQEEAPSLGKPVLVFRETTERIEGIKYGTSKLIGTNINNVFNEANRLLKNKKLYLQMSQAKNPYGNGDASEKILQKCLTFLGIDSK